MNAQERMGSDMKTALVLVDIQNDYFPGGRHELVGPEQAAGEAARLLALFREKGWPVFHIRHVSLHAQADFFLPDTVGAEIHASCAPHGGEAVIVKHAPDSFLGTDLKVRLDEAGVDRLVVAGMMTHMCIDTTVRSAVGQGYGVDLIEDACATRDLQRGDVLVPAEQAQQAFLAAMSGVFATVVKADAWIAAHAAG